MSRRCCESRVAASGLAPFIYHMVSKSYFPEVDFAWCPTIISPPWAACLPCGVRFAAFMTDGANFSRRIGLFGGRSLQQRCGRSNGTDSTSSTYIAPLCNIVAEHEARLTSGRSATRCFTIGHVQSLLRSFRNGPRNLWAKMRARPRPAPRPCAETFTRSRRASRAKRAPVPPAPSTQPRDAPWSIPAP